MRYPKSNPGNVPLLFCIGDMRGSHVFVYNNPGSVSFLFSGDVRSSNPKSVSFLFSSEMRGSNPESVSFLLLLGVWSLIVGDDIGTGIAICSEAEIVRKVVIILCSVDDGDAVNL